MAEFLYGEALSERIRDVVRGKNLRCAVAFWGAGAVEELFGNEILDREDVWIVCDISMGGTNPDTLCALGAPNNENLGHIEGLHAKLYHSDAGMVVGSANASRNGIGFMNNAAGLVESGMFIKSGTKTWKAARTWFEEDVWSQSTEIDEPTLMTAQITWRNRYFANNRPPFRQAREVENIREFLDYNSREHGLVYLAWFEEDDEGVNFNDDAPADIRNETNENWMNFARGDQDIHGAWICGFLLNAHGQMHGRRNPIYFFADSILDRVIEDNEDYPILVFQGNIEAAVPPPFNTDDEINNLFREVINQPGYADLRNHDGQDRWCATDHVELMHRFWRDVQTEYRRRHGAN